jgi:hypothetical protein
MRIEEMKNPEFYESLYFPSGIECGDGWKSLLDDMTDELKKKNHLVKFSQVKEKWGRLTVYCYSYFEDTDEIICKYEEKSEKICEVCGKRGKLYDDGWMKVRCKNCMKIEKF